MSVSEVDELLEELMKIKETCQRLFHPRYLASNIRTLLGHRLCHLCLCAALFLVSALVVLVHRLGALEDQNTSNASVLLGRRSYNVGKILYRKQFA